MGIERTLSIVKPDAMLRQLTGEIIQRFEISGLRLVGAKLLRLTVSQAGCFYAIHKDRAFFTDLVRFMSSGPITALVLEGENAVMRNREIIGATDPKEAEKGTIRGDLAESIDHNGVHGSDSLQTAKQEIQFFFTALDLLH